MPEEKINETNNDFIPVGKSIHQLMRFVYHIDYLVNYLHKYKAGSPAPEIIFKTDVRSPETGEKIGMDYVVPDQILDKTARLFGLTLNAGPRRIHNHLYFVDHRKDPGIDEFPSHLQLNAEALENKLKEITEKEVQILHIIRKAIQCAKARNRLVFKNYIIIAGRLYQHTQCDQRSIYLPVGFKRAEFIIARYGSSINTRFSHPDQFPSENVPDAKKITDSISILQNYIQQTAEELLSDIDVTPF